MAQYTLGRGHQPAAAFAISPALPSFSAFQHKSISFPDGGQRREDVTALLNVDPPNLLPELSQWV